jgi:hypothetical protein
VGWFWNLEGERRGNWKLETLKWECRGLPSVRSVGRLSPQYVSFSTCACSHRCDKPAFHSALLLSLTSKLSPFLSRPAVGMQKGWGKSWGRLVFLKSFFLFFPLPSLFLERSIFILTSSDECVG